MKIAIVKYNAGNIKSVQNALTRIGAESIVTANPELIRSADRVIFPGVGEASSAMRYLKQRKLDRLISGLRQPVMGICLGMQLLMDYSFENDTACLGVVKGKVRRFESETLKVPHMGWNNVSSLEGQLFEGIPDGAYFYFVHSYYVQAGDYDTSSTGYGVRFCSSLHHNNFFAVQFHPEKSGPVGEQLLRNFLK